MSALTALPRRAGPVVLVSAALLFGALSVGYAWIVARHLRNDARETSRLLGHVFAGLNDPLRRAAHRPRVHRSRGSPGRDVPLSRLAGGLGDARAPRRGARPAVGGDGARVRSPARHTAHEHHGLD